MDNHQLRSNLIEKLEKLSPEQLNSVWQFVESLDIKSETSKTNSEIEVSLLCYSQENKIPSIGLSKGEFIGGDDLKNSSPDDIKETFYKLVEQWKKETFGISSTTDLIMHPAYQQIIGMGDDVIPLLLKELENKTGRWFWALKSITRIDPVLPEFRGNTQEMIAAWLDWGRKKGYSW